MSSLNATSVAVIIFIVVAIFTGLNLVGEESISNSNLDTSSQLLIINLNSQLDNNFGDLTIAQSNLSANASFQGQDPFVQQFLESKQQESELSGLTNKVKSTPDLLILSINDGIGEDTLSTWRLLLLAFITIIIFIVGFVAIFGRGRITA